MTDASSSDQVDVCVVIPAYNVEAEIAEAVTSVLRQTHTRLQVVVVDDGSSDRTAARAEEIGDPRVTVLRKPNGGAASARNEGLRHCRAEYVAFLDADDTWEPSKLEQCLGAISGHVAVGHRMQYMNENGARLPAAAGEAPGSVDRIAAAEFLPYPLSSMLFRSSAVEAAGEFDETLVRSQDIDFVSRVAAIGTLGWVPEVLGCYRLRPGSLSASGHAEQRMYWRYVVARRAGDTRTVSEFISEYSLSARERRSDRAAVLYRRGGLRLSVRDPRGGLDIIGAALASPRYVLLRILRQATALGGGRHGGDAQSRSQRG